VSINELKLVAKNAKEPVFVNTTRLNQSAKSAVGLPIANTTNGKLIAKNAEALLFVKHLDVKQVKVRNMKDIVFPVSCISSLTNLILVIIKQKRLQ
jgi:hypothetical protein